MFFDRGVPDVLGYLLLSGLPAPEHMKRAVDLFLDGAPEDLLAEKLDLLGIDRVAYDRDIAQIRRLTPGPVRRTIRRVPVLIGTAADAIQHIGLGPRMRSWINREDPIA